MSAGGLDVEAFLDRLRGIATEWESAHDQLETLRISTTSRDRLATATADSGGSVVDLVLAPGLRRHGSEVVAASILEATSAAVEQANTRRAELVSGSVALAVSGRRREAEDAARHHTDPAPAGRGTA
ncbi:YbaB/EbfC DNA-binding family protein [Dietzia kunjamensis]|uniref:YbaB/EbfC family nucleoid-associated protein n=1 Tax=Dietzia TaxID=37914 RepID=UPI000E72E566|nr:YbaB/EbfC family nucleoid-associated protein [Dietzia kunjamensis]MBB1012824.1 YbaB/EbfC family nucleoid-associated protein [Dietzia kunjamensis]RKE58515.1 YbaB/EbfC DNA-binding family protein [Dietzia kunjamensis]